MQLEKWFARAAGSGMVAGAAGARGLTVNAADWQHAAEDMAAQQGRLLSLWASVRHEGGGAGGSDSTESIVRAAYISGAGVLVLSLPVAASESEYPGIERFFPCAGRMQRAVADLCGLRSDAADSRPWLRHAAWPGDYFPLRHAHAPAASPPAPENYAFVSVAGEGVHEIPVGPVHAGIIEPGHFRFSVVGEKVLKLEERLGYVHKGIERRFTELPLMDGHRLAARVSGDSAAAFSWAYCQALEGMCAAVLPPRALALRAVALELERLANHLGDLGALGNDAGFAFGLAQFSRLKELLLRASERAWGRRYLMDLIVPGGVQRDLPQAPAAALCEAIEAIAAEIPTLREIYDEHAGLRDRIVGAGVVAPALAAVLGLTGLAGRASGQAFDLRCDLPCDPYLELQPRKAVRHEGDVAARIAVRFDEALESASLMQRALRELPGGAHRVELSLPQEGSFGIGLIEGWRGPALLALEAGADGSIRRAHPHDPSWQNWPALERAILDNIVPDFPLINKSFNLSYSGHDL